MKKWLITSPGCPDCKLVKDWIGDRVSNGIDILDVSDPKKHAIAMAKLAMCESVKSKLPVLVIRNGDDFVAVHGVAEIKEALGDGRGGTDQTG